eukprot:TRINITY_DN4590_c1_g7_i1.p1 TRINITY_DN4590_c1_g7~~TRINITY_DN4590_c1_g7_i1.p1  ORF type:complete len:488 (+),score=226.54 TRINITY_DN4590_c1_g7_i1:100-1563(+)
MQDIDLGEVTDRDWKCATFKQEEDFTDRTAALLAEWGSEHAARIQKEGRVEEAVAKLLEMEKRTRLGGDAKNCIRVATEIMRLLVAAASVDKLLEYGEILMKRRAQMKGVQIVVVKEAQKAVDAAADKETKMKLLKQLRDMCSGKLHVELEFARISVQMATILEADGKIKECVELMNEVQVETITNMERTEKLKILLLQIRLNLDVDDYIRAAIMARKSSNRALSKPDSMLIKVDYFQLMLRYYGHFKSYMHLAKCWMELFALTTSEDFQKQHSDHPLASQGESSLTHVLLYLILSPPKLMEDEKVTDCAAFSPWNKRADRLELVAKYAGERIARGLSNYQLIAKQFQSKELIHWPQFAERNADLRQHPVFAAMTEGDERWEALRLRVTQHNIKVISRYYQRLNLKRLAQLIDLDEARTEQSVCDMVIAKDLWARVDRIDGVVTFCKKKDATGATADWAQGVDHVLGQITTACHLIQKEYMVHGLAR